MATDQLSYKYDMEFLHAVEGKTQWRPLQLQSSRDNKAGQQSHVPANFNISRKKILYVISIDGMAPAQHNLCGTNERLSDFLNVAKAHTLECFSMKKFRGPIHLSE